MVTRNFQPAFSSGILSPALQARVDFQKYDAALKDALNALVRPEGGAVKAPGTRFVADTGNPGKVRLIPFVYNMKQSYALEFSHGRIRVITDQGLVAAANGQAFAVASPYREEDLFQLTYTQSADVLYIAHKNYPQYKLMRYGHADWRLQQMAFMPGMAAPPSVTAAWVGSATGTLRTWRYQVTAVNQVTGEESLPSHMVGVAGHKNMRVNMYSGGDELDDRYVVINWSGVPGANEYRVYKEINENSLLFGYIGSAMNTTFQDKNIAPNAEDSPPGGFSPFENGNWPGVVSIHQQRLMYFSSASRPITGWGSRVGQYENFTRGLRAKADDFVEFTLDSRQLDPVVWAVSLRGLVLGTAGDVQFLNGAGDGGSLVPGGIRADRQSCRSSAEGMMPVVIDSSILHVNRTRDKVYDLSYNYAKDAYGGDDRSLLAAHLFENRRIIDSAYQESPYSVVWYVMSDGVLLGLTWMAEQNVFAWHRHGTRGGYESVCALPGDEQTRVFFVVKRTVNGRERRFVEMLEEPLITPDGFDGLSDAERMIIQSRAFYVHCGLTYEGPGASRLYGLDHLEGEEVAILADGAVHPLQVVRNGSVSLERVCKVVHVGLPYDFRVETVNFEPQAQNGPGVGKPKRIVRVGVRFHDTSAARVGVNGQTVTGKWRDTENYDNPSRLRSGTMMFTVPGFWSRDTSVVVGNSEPTPVTVLSVSPEVSMEG